MSIIITTSSNNTVLVSQNVICFDNFMPMSHDVNKKAPTIVFPLPLPLARFSPDSFVVLQEILYQPFFCFDQIIVKNNAFSN